MLAAIEQPAFEFEQALIDQKKIDPKRLFGNRCGHDPKNPTYYPTASMKEDKLPFPILKAKENSKKYNDDQTTYLPRLKENRTSDRKQRSEGREAQIALVQFLVTHVDLASAKRMKDGDMVMAVAFPNDDTGDLFAYSLNKLAYKLGFQSEDEWQEDRQRVKLGLSPNNHGVRRLSRRIKELTDARYIKFTQQRNRIDTESGTYTALAAIRFVSEQLFYALGVSKQCLIRAIEIARKIQRRRRNAKQAAKLQEKLGGIGIRVSEQQKHKGSYLNARALRIKAHAKKMLELLGLPENKCLLDKNGSTTNAFWAKYPEMKVSPS